VAPLKNNEKNPSLLCTMLINRFEGHCATFGKGKKNPLSSMTLGQFGWIFFVLFFYTTTMGWMLA